MKSLLLPIVYFALLLSGPFHFLQAREIELTGGINNLAYNPEYNLSDSTEVQTAQILQFEDYRKIIGNFSLKNEISDVLGYKIKITRDSILQNNLIGNIIVNTENLNLEFGAFFGISDDFKKPDLGITGGLELIFPGIIFLSVNGSTSLSIKNELMGNYNRETAGAKFGFWLPNLLPVFSADIKTYAREEENSLIIKDELIRFMFSVDIFAKNFPLLIHLDAGYGILSRTYKNGNSDSFEIKNIFAGLEIRWQIIRQFRLIAGFEMPVYIIEPAKNAPDFFSLYKAYGGFALTFF